MIFTPARFGWGFSFALLALSREIDFKAVLAHGLNKLLILCLTIDFALSHLEFSTFGNKKALAIVYKCRDFVPFSSFSDFFDLFVFFCSAFSAVGYCV